MSWGNFSQSYPVGVSCIHFHQYFVPQICVFSALLVLGFCKFFMWVLDEHLRISRRCNMKTQESSYRRYCWLSCLWVQWCSNQFYSHFIKLKTWFNNLFFCLNVHMLLFLMFSLLLELWFCRISVLMVNWWWIMLALWHGVNHHLLIDIVQLYPIERYVILNFMS